MTAGLKRALLLSLLTQQHYPGIHLAAELCTSGCPLGSCTVEGMGLKHTKSTGQVRAHGLFLSLSAPAEQRGEVRVSDKNYQTDKYKN